MWLSKGQRPWAVIGHSLGEYAAATIAGVWSIKDCLKVVCERGRLMSDSPECRGVMMVRLSFKK